MEHQSVLLREAIDSLNIKPDGCYIDGTFGRGGHSAAILDQLSDAGRLIAMDKDREAINAAAQHRFSSDKRFMIKHCSLDQLLEVVEQENLVGQIDGVLLDLGVSSPQLDDASRGFSFMRDGPLDMRMDQQQGETAAEWLNRANEEEIRMVLKVYGEEKFSSRIARMVVQRRQDRPITTTGELVDIIEDAVPYREKHKHPATRTFQAIRIYINRELEQLTHCLEQALSVLKVGGRLAVITFHSLEDRIVKSFMQKNEKDTRYPADFPIKQDKLQAKLKRVGKVIKPSANEVKYNTRARSATLRVMEKLG